ncbi:MAG: NAD-glutamate dehydrogenase [Alphaproteobacteria bacterium]|nr:NAD-glutamate dehydrogenase [Alphaproteobacteria bacterium]
MALEFPMASSHTNLFKTAKAHLNTKGGAKLKSFFDKFWEETTEDDLASVSPVAAARITEYYNDKITKRKTGDVSIDIYVPEKKKHGWENAHTVIDIVSDDMPFLIDSIVTALADRGYGIDLIIHPEFEDKRFTKMVSCIHVQLSAKVPARVGAEIKSEIAQILHDVEFATKDWLALKAKLKDTKAKLLSAKTKYPKRDIEEYGNFLDYLHDDNFTLLGYREYKFKSDKKGVISTDIVKGAGLGLLSDDKTPAYINHTYKSLPNNLQKLRLNMPPLHVTKLNRKSTVHRRVPIDAVSIKQYDKDGNVVGERLFIGLFTSVTYSRSINSTPYLRLKADKVIEKSGFPVGSHDYRALRHILEKYPRDELFQIEIKNLFEICESLLRLQERPRIALYTRPDPFGRYVSCLVYVPRERYDTRIRLQMQRILEQGIGGACNSYQFTVDDSPLARVNYIITTPEFKPHKYNKAALEARLQQTGRAWSERLFRALLVHANSEDEAVILAENFKNAFPTAYQDEYNDDEIVKDVFQLDKMVKENTGIGFALYSDNKPRLADKDSDFGLKIYHNSQALTLSSILPVLENFGLHVIAEVPFETEPMGHGTTVWIQDMLLKHKNGELSNLAAARARFEEALYHVHAGTIENDPLNGLVFTTPMNARQIAILRGYVRYMRHTTLPHSVSFIEQTVTAYPSFAEKLMQFFENRFDPALKKRRDETQFLKEIEKEFEQVVSLDQEKILRALLSLVNATLRTNAWLGHSYISYKIAPRGIDALPQPRPFREIFIYSPRVEGVHLRGDKVARGGIRWSDRAEDFRNEILGLIKAQMVKNSIIVPTGAKGGFIVKNPPAMGDRAATQQEGIECYKIFIRGLLDITDNQKAGKIIPPKNVVRHDEDDPYLVVAADKGTATFSDIANSLSLEYKFWLGDAFASGGSAGYDHKKMGITARGAWEAVKRHFRELDHDTQNQPFDVVGVGDMGGDVFGNGMLQSPHTRLIGAFNHLHIFCDPDPNPAASFKERQRLFDNVLGWDQYDTKKLSKGGRIYKRSDKHLELTPEIQKRFALSHSKVTPAELIQAILMAEADLLFFGGIGTYVKASSESHVQGGDKANDNYRIDAKQLRVRVIGEGANLAMTQRARIEAAQKGVKLNTDFVDNSGGVDCSDHEVNIKILLSNTELKTAERNKLLAAMTEDVAALVLGNNYQQTQAISLMERQAVDKLDKHAALISQLERDKWLISRQLEVLPDDEEIDRRAKAGQGLTRPELAVLQAYAKMKLTSDLLRSSVPDRNDVQDWLIGYFPPVLVKKFEPLIQKHLLKREIIATLQANSIINRLGITFISRITSDMGKTLDEVMPTLLTARDALGLRKLWRQIEQLDSRISATAQLQAMEKLSNCFGAICISIERQTSRPDRKTFVDAFNSMLKLLPDCLPQSGQDDFHAAFTAMKAEGLPENIAHIIAATRYIATIPSLLSVAERTKKKFSDVLASYWQMAETISLTWIENQIDQLPKMTTEQRQARDVLRSQLAELVASMTALRVMDKPMRMENIIAVTQVMKRSGTADLSALLVMIEKMKTSLTA